LKRRKVTNPIRRGVFQADKTNFATWRLSGTARGSPRMIGSPEQAYVPGFELP